MIEIIAERNSIPRRKCGSGEMRRNGSQNDCREDDLESHIYRLLFRQLYYG